MKWENKKKNMRKQRMFLSDLKQLDNKNLNG